MLIQYLDLLYKSLFFTRIHPCPKGAVSLKNQRYYIFSTNNVLPIDTMNILFIANAASIHTIRFVEYFVQKKYEVHLISYLPPDAPIPGVILHILPSLFSNIFLDFFPRQLYIQKIIARVQPDLIHAMYVSKFGWHLVPIRKIPTLLTALGDDILILPHTGLIYFLYTKLALKKADIIYAVSEHIRQAIITEYNIPENTVKNLPIGVDLSVFYPGIVKSPANSHQIRIFSNRGFRHEYDPKTIIDAVASVHASYPDSMLFLKGGGPERQAFEEYVFLQGFDSFIHFLDRTDYSSVADDYRKTDIFISAAISDGTPVSMLEAMACGVACVMTDVGGVPEWIRDGHNGLVFPPKRPDILADKIRFLLDNPDERVKLGNNAQKTIEFRGDWARLMRELEDDYSALV